MSWAYYTPKGFRFRGIPLSFNSLEGTSHELLCGLGATIGPRHERIVAPRKFHPWFVKRHGSALPATAGRPVQFGGAQVCFEHSTGQFGPQPVLIERGDGYRVLVLQDIPLFELTGIEAEEVLVHRYAPNARGGMALSAVVDQVICLQQAGTTKAPFRIASTRLDLAWALVQGLKARGVTSRFSGTWRRLSPDDACPESPDFMVCPADGHAKRLKVSAWISSVSEPRSQASERMGCSLVIRDVGGLGALRRVLAQTGAAELVAPKDICAEFQQSSISVSSVTEQESFNW